MNTSDQPTNPVVETEDTQSTARWTALSSIQRRVAGVLIEKSKTTPDIYPMTLNSIKTASNQKSNRSPQMDLREDQVEQALYELRQLGAVIEVHSGGRVPKFKHQLYDWFGVEKVELAVLAELLLRGEQTLGDLRGRASRMDRIADVQELKPIVASLVNQGLVIELTPPGRGQMVTHGVYKLEEMDRLRSQFSGSQGPTETMFERSSSDSSGTSDGPATLKTELPGADHRIDQLAQEVAELKQTVHKLHQQLLEIQELLK